MMTFGGILSPVRAFFKNSRKDAADASFSDSMHSSDESSALSLRSAADFFCSFASSARVLYQTRKRAGKIEIKCVTLATT
jgi:hypothetical protein